MTTATKLTYEDYKVMPDDGHYYQLIDGELIMSPSPTSRHQRVLGRISNAMYNFVESKNLGVVYFAPLDVVLSDEIVVQPDAMFVSSARLKIIESAGVFSAPDLCVEVLSKSNRKLDLGRKRQIYAQHGLQELWIVDPLWNTIDRYRFKENATEPVESLGEKDVLKSPLLPGFELKLADVFAE